MSTRPILPDARPTLTRLERPLSIVTSEEMGVSTPGAFLVSAGKRRRAAEVVAPAGEFDGGRAFRELDDVRTHAENVFHWVEESLAMEPAPDPAPLSPPFGRVMRAWLPFLLTAAAVGSAALLLSDDWVFPLAVALVPSVGALLAGMVRHVRGTRAAVVTALVLAALVGVVIPIGGGLAAVRVVTGVVGVFFAFVRFHPGERLRRADEESDGPVEYVLREGEAARYRPELCLADDVLCVVIRCESANGHLMRQVVVPVQGATREDAVRAALWARDYDIALRREREDEATADDELRRVKELERSRRTLPEP